MYNLARLLTTQEKYAEAETLYRKSLPMMYKVCIVQFVLLACNHFCKVWSEENVAGKKILVDLPDMLRKQGKYKEAEPLYRESLAIAREVDDNTSHRSVLCLFLKGIR
jgi:tetratricopeptide (TPR) repeat protein